MNENLKKRWITALRSGKYKQGIGKLYNPEKDTYCCLGVLCNIQRIPIEKYTNMKNLYELDYIKNLPKELLVNEPHKSTTFEGPDFDYLGLHNQLVKLNDGANGGIMKSRDFNYIANWIEKNL